MWKGIKQPKFTSDISSTAMVKSDFTAMPFMPKSLDAIIFDPPHLEDGGKNGIMTKRYSSANMRELFNPFLQQARICLRPGGIILAKISDGVHSNKYQWYHADYLAANQHNGFEAIDCAIRVSTHSINDPKWKRVLHMRRSHVYWIVSKCLDQ